MLLNTVSLTPSTVTRISKGTVRRARRPNKPRLLAVVDSQSVRVDARIMAHLRSAGVDFRYVEVLSATEVVVHNERVR